MGADIESDERAPPCASRAQRASKLRLIVPILLAVTATTVAVTLVSAQTGCGDNDGPTVDAAPDTPLL